MKRSMKPPQLYKLTVDGRSPHTGYEWDLPERGQPGAWHEVKAPVVPHKNGFHLTSDPNRHWSGGREVWRVEVEDARRLEHSEDEWVARRVRLVERLGPAELDRLKVGVRTTFRSGPRGGLAVRRVDPEGASPVVRLVSIVHEHGQGATRAGGDRALDGCIWKAWDLALDSGMEFGLGDFAVLERMVGGLGSEHVYARVCRSGNGSAVRAWERWTGRAPWMWQGGRLHVGAELPWAGRSCTVTSIHDGEGRLVACSYRERGRDEHGHERGRAKVERRFSVTREQLAAADRALKRGLAWKEATDALVRAVWDISPVRWGRDETRYTALLALVAVWTPEQREAAAAWAHAREHDRGKARIRVPAVPPHVAEASASADAHVVEREAAYERWRASSEFADLRGDLPAIPIEAPVARARAALEAWAERLWAGHPHEHLRGLPEAGPASPPPPAASKPAPARRPRPDAPEARA